MDFFGFIAHWIQSKRRVNLYSEEQQQVLQELEDEVRLAEAEEYNEDNEYNEILPNEYMVGPSYSSSSISPAASGAPVVGKVALNKMGMPYFESLESRLGQEEKEEEFFKKEEFDIEE